jgi:hypothetical protein
MDEYPSEISSKLLHESAEVLGERQDDLPCWQCGKYGDTLIVKIAYFTYDVCHGCAKKLGIEW